MKKSIVLPLGLLIFFLFIIVLEYGFVFVKSNDYRVVDATQNKAILTIGYTLRSKELSYPLLDIRTKKSTSLLAIIKKNTDRDIIINFWATWCPSCIEELPSLIKLEKDGAKGSPHFPLFILICVDDTLKEVPNFLSKLPFAIDSILLHDPKMVFAKSLGVSAIPETYLVDRHSLQIKKNWLGPENWLSQDIISDFSQYNE